MIDGGSNSLIIRGTEYPTQNDDHMSSLACLTEDCTLEPQSITSVRASRACSTYHKDGTYITSQAEGGVLRDEPGIVVANSVNVIKKSKAFGI